MLVSLQQEHATITQCCKGQGTPCLVDARKVSGAALRVVGEGVLTARTKHSAPHSPGTAAWAPRP